MMPTAAPRQSQTRKPALRKPVNARSLQMMLSSGVVRRADLNPPIVPTWKEPAWMGNAGEVHSQEEVSAQGWLLRLLTRCKSAASV